MQNYMFLGLKSPYKAIFSLHFAQIALAGFAILAGLVASGSVFLNDLYFWGQSDHYINPYLFLIAFFLAFSPEARGLAAIIFLLPLSAGLGTQLNAYLGTHFLILPNAGLDLVAGFFLGSALREISKYSHFLGKNRYGDLTLAMRGLVPWPVTLVIVMITISTAIAISRNVYQSAAATSFKGLLFNLVHFRPIGWHDDYMPISDWIAYALAVAMIILVIGQLRGRENKNPIIFRPIMAGLIIASLMAVSQAITGMGLPENLLSFRKDQLGYAVIGFQPDLHAFAGYMLLGAVGLWGYFYSGISRLERKLVLLVVALSWVGLILSKSRALLLIAFVAMLIWFVWCLRKKKNSFFLPTIAMLASVITIFIVLIFNFSNSLDGIPVLSWLGELAYEFKSRDLTSWSLFSGIFGSRFEIWEAAIRMWWEFPLMGVGQGNFYRLSDIASFSKSHFLILNHGENAHNYFFQSLTETGVLGILIFAIALLCPLFAIKNSKIILPASIAIVSLLLGNVFSHSLLVRENLCLLAVMLGCAYSSSGCRLNSNYPEFACGSKGQATHMHLVCAALVILLMSATLHEVYRSFGRTPFERGFYCFGVKSIDADGWVLGGWKLPLPQEASNVNLVIYFPPLNDRSGLDSSGFVTTIEDSDGVVFKPASINLIKSGIASIYFELDRTGKESLKKNIELKIQGQNCYTPRNKGESVDARRLGVRIESLYINGLKIH